MAKTPFSSTYPKLGSKNYLMNSNFRFGQLGSSFSTPSSGTITLDRWSHDYDGTSGTFTILRGSFAPGELFSDGVTAPKFYVRWNQTVAGSGNNYRYFRQRIEGVETLAGKTVTLSFRARASVGGTQMGLRYEQFFGTGGSPSALAGANPPDTFSLTTSWAFYKATFTIPSIAGKTLGTNSNDWLGIFFRMPINAIFQIDISNVMLNEGGDAADWHLMGENENHELSLIQRFLCKSYNTDTNPGTATWAGAVIANVMWIGGNDMSSSTSFPVRMRAIPSLAVYSPSTGASGQAGRSNGSNLSGITSPGVSDIGASLNWHNSGGVDDAYEGWHFVANAEL